MISTTSVPVYVSEVKIRMICQSVRCKKESNRISANSRKCRRLRELLHLTPRGTCWHLYELHSQENFAEKLFPTVLDFLVNSRSDNIKRRLDIAGIQAKTPGYRMWLLVYPKLNIKR
jgi:hypothetical protein